MHSTIQDDSTAEVDPGDLTAAAAIPNEHQVDQLHANVGNREAIERVVATLAKGRELVLSLEQLRRQVDIQLPAAGYRAQTGTSHDQAMKVSKLVQLGEQLETVDVRCGFLLDSFSIVHERRHKMRHLLPGTHQIINPALWSLCRTA